MPNSDLEILLCLTPGDFTLSNARRFYSSKGRPPGDLRVDSKPIPQIKSTNYLALIRGFHSTKIHSRAFSVVMGEATPSLLVAAAGLYKEWQDSEVEVIIF